MSVTLVFSSAQGSSTLTFDSQTYTTTDANITYVSNSSSITSLGSSDFRNNNQLVSVSISSSVTSIGNICFESCVLLSSVSLANGLLTIGASAFGSCPALTSIIIPSSVTTIGNACFEDSGLTTIRIPSSVVTIGTYIVAGNPLTTLYTDIPGTPIVSYFQTNYPLVNIIYDFPPNAICFKEDTQILCSVDNKEVYVPINKLKKGDLVKTYKGSYLPVSMLGTSKVYNPQNSRKSANRLYTYSKKTHPELIDDLVITGGHSVCVDSLSDSQSQLLLRIFKGLGKIDDKFLVLACLDESAQPYSVEGLYTVWHVALDAENDDTIYGIYANGKLVESCSKSMMMKTKNIVE